MSQGNVQFVLRCGQCNKPFDKRGVYLYQVILRDVESVLTYGLLESTLKRHGYYCRSRRAGSTTRSRSCNTCAARKAFCDNRRPKCSRCRTKAIECHYPANIPKGTPPRVQRSDDAPTEQRKRIPSLVTDFQEASNDSGIILDSALLISDPVLATVGGEHLEWNDSDVNFADFLNPQSNDETVQYPSSESLSLVRHSTPSTDATFPRQQAISSPNVSIPPLPTSTLRSLIQRPSMKAGAQRIANLILHTLKSYPLMMLRHNTLPPFIHPRLIASKVENNHMEPLNNCISLVHMISSGVQGSRKLFWKNVRLECERLFGEVR